MRLRQLSPRSGATSLAVLVAVAAVSAARCSKPPPATLHDLANRYVRVTLQLAQHQPTLVETWLGPDSLQASARIPVADLARTVGEIATEADRVKPGDLDPTEHARLRYLRGQLRALTLAARRLSGESMRFNEELRLAFAVELPRDAETVAADARAALDAELKGPGVLVNRYAEFRRNYAVAPDRVEVVFRAAIDACRAATAAQIKMPRDERIDLGFDPSIELAGAARYAGDHQTRLAIRSREGWDVSRVLHMACHESYPGHHLQHILIDDALVRGRGWQEFQLTPAFGPHLLIAEGAAEAALDLALPENARTQLYRERLLPAAGVDSANAARLARVDTLARPLELAVPSILARYFDNAATESETVAALRLDALVSSPESLLAFAERRRTAAVAYPLGHAVVSNWLARDTRDPERWRRLQDIFTRDPFKVD